jgi:glutaminyl-peptide cyclotransferase
MKFSFTASVRMTGFALAWALVFAGCKARGEDGHSTAAASPPFMSTVAQNPPQAASDAPPPVQTGGFDGKLAYEYTAKQVSFGPRPAGSPALAKLQDYLISQLKSFGCDVDTDAFSADTPIGRLEMKNIVAKIPGERPGIILLGTHYDTLRMDNFVGADDGASSTGLMLEMAKLLCGKRERYAIWIAFFDGEEAQGDWTDKNSVQWTNANDTYGSREMAARMALSGDLKKIRAMMLADIVGGKNLRMMKDTSSTPWLNQLVWSTAARLGYCDEFVSQATSVQDDHDSFLKRGVPSADIVNDFADLDYWHTPQDAMDKISARSLAIVGHVFLESVKELEAK